MSETRGTKVPREWGTGCKSVNGGVLTVNNL